MSERGRTSGGLHVSITGWVVASIATVALAVVANRFLYGFAQFFGTPYSTGKVNDHLPLSFVLIVVMGLIAFVAIALPPWITPLRIRVSISLVAAILVIVFFSIAIAFFPYWLQ